MTAAPTAPSAPRIWLRLEAALGFILIAFALMQTGQMMGAMISTSLNTDEFGTVGSFSSKGPVRVITDYRAPKNHIFFNLANSLLPGRESLNPARARLLSVVATAAIPVLLLLVALHYQRVLEAGVFLVLWSLAPKMLELSMEARGYGFLALFALISCAALWRYSETASRFWLGLLTLATVLGVYTVPSYILFGGPLLLLVWIASRRRDAFFAGVITIVLILLLHLPVLTQILAAYRDVKSYDENDFTSAAGVIRTVKLYLFPASDAAATGFLAFLALAPFAVLTAVRSPATRTFAILALSTLTAFAAILVIQSPPVRVAAFLTVPLAFAGIFATGTIIREFAPLPLRITAVAALAFLLISKALTTLRPVEFVPAEDWSRTARFIDAAFPPDAQVDFKRHAKYLKQTLADSTQRSADYSDNALRSGQLIVAEASNKWAEGRQFQLPADAPRLAEITVPGTIRDIVLSLRVPDAHHLIDPPAALTDGDPKTGVTPEGLTLRTELHPEAHALVILLDRPVRPRLMVANVRDDATNELLETRGIQAGNALTIPIPEGTAITVEVIILDPEARLTEAWLTTRK